MKMGSFYFEQLLCNHANTRSRNIQFDRQFLENYTRRLHTIQCSRKLHFAWDDVQER